MKSEGDDMKRFKEFLIMFVSFLVLWGLSVLGFVFTTSSSQFFGATYYLKLMFSPSMLVVYADSFFIMGLPALLLSGIFAFLIRNKKAAMGRKKYYTYLFLISLIAPVVITLILTRRFDFVNNTITSLQTGLVVIFLHWVFEWLCEKFKSRKRT